jgi:hypothetical protein
MPVLSRGAAVRDAVDSYNAVEGRSDACEPDLLAVAQLIALGIGTGRLAVGGAMLLAPTFSVRLLGVDAATAKRVRFLARTTAVRDAALGAGTLVGALGSGAPSGAASWLLAGAVADGMDAVALAAALRQRAVRALPAAAVAVGAAATAVVGGWAAIQLRRKP